MLIQALFMATLLLLLFLNDCLRLSVLIFQFQFIYLKEVFHLFQLAL